MGVSPRSSFFMQRSRAGCLVIAPDSSSVKRFYTRPASTPSSRRCSPTAMAAKKTKSLEPFHCSITFSAITFELHDETTRGHASCLQSCGLSLRLPNGKSAPIQKDIEVEALALRKSA
jgi:hypothetical protein